MQQKKQVSAIKRLRLHQKFDNLLYDFPTQKAISKDIFSTIVTYLYGNLQNISYFYMTYKI